MPHTVKVERRNNELVIHVALLNGPDARLPNGVLLHSEGWVNIGHGLKMFLVIGSENMSYRASKVLEEKKGLFQRLFNKKQQPLLEAR